MDFFQLYLLKINLSFFQFVLIRFINREGIDFSDAQSMQPVQVLLSPHAKEYTVKFKKVYLKRLHFP